MSISELAIRRPVATIMTVIVMVFVGIVTMMQLPSRLMPDFAFPIVSIQTTWVGSSPEDMDKLVTREIEDILPTIDGVNKITSYSGQNYSNIIVEFDFGVDTDNKVSLIQTEISKIRGDMPDDIDEPYVSKINVTGGDKVLSLSILGKDLVEVKSFAENTLKPRLERINGVGSVDIDGGLEKVIMVRIEPTKLESYDLSVNDVVNIMSQSSINIPAGTIIEGDKEILLRVMGEIETLEQVENIIMANRDGNIIRLKDVVDVSLTTKERESYSRADRIEAISLSISASKEGNAVKIAEEVDKQLKEIKDYIPAGMEIVKSYDSTVEISSSIGTVANNAITALVLAVLVLMFFLRNIRATFIIGAAIPISILFTFFLLGLKGITLNRISLLGLSLGVGMLVDNSVVVLDNIYRKIKEEGKNIFDAAKEGAEEMVVPIIASTLTTVAVFAPVLFKNGLAREVFHDMSWSIIFALTSSLVVAITFVPMASFKLLKASDSEQKDNKVIRVLKKSYYDLIRVALKHKMSVLIITIVLFIGVMFVGIKTVQTEFFPETDNSQYTLTASLAKGLDIEKTNRISKEIESLIVNDTNTVKYNSVIKTDEIVINVDTLSKNKRKESVFEIMEKMRIKMKVIPDITTAFTAGNKGGGGGSNSVQILGNNITALANLSSKLTENLKKSPNFIDVESSYEGGNPEAKIIIDRTKAQYYDMRAADINKTISYQIRGTEPLTIKTENEEIDVTVKLIDEYKNSTEKLMEMRFKTPTGETIQLKDVASLEISEGPSEIIKQDKIQRIEINYNLKNIGLAQAQVEVEGILKDIGVAKGIKYSFGGDNENMKEVMTDLGAALAIAIFLIYFILTVQFESFMTPLIVMGAVPLGAAGVYFGLLVTGVKFSIMVMIGIIMLAGIVVNNAIVLIDYIHVLEKKGLNLNSAIVKAGITRLRPILMTTATTVFGMIPLALAIGEGGEFFQGMGVAVGFGLTISTVLTLIFIPVVYAGVERIKRKIFKS